MKKKVCGSFCELNGKSYYKIENYDLMDNFFMTITSSSDVWNFCWSKGGITAGRIDSNHAVFPYYTADKVSDAASYTGNFTAIAVKTKPAKSAASQNDDDGSSISIWEPFAALRAAPSVQAASSTYLFRNIYKNLNGTEVLFEEINTRLKLKFLTGWTSSEKYGLVRYSQIVNLSDDEIECSVLDGCQNIMPACCTSDFQNTKSVLLDAYKKTDLEENVNLTLFTLSSVVSDKAEPNEGLYANTCWFSTNDKVILSTDAPAQFAALASGISKTGKTGKPKLPKYKDFITTNCLKGERPSCFICQNLKLKGDTNNKFSTGAANQKAPVSAASATQKVSAEWYQVFDTALNSSKVSGLIAAISSKKAATRDLKNNIAFCDSQMTNFIQATDGIQHTADKITCLHHRENVMFNIMRGGIILDDGKIDSADFILFAKQRNKKLGDQLEKLLKTKAAAHTKQATETNGVQSSSFSYSELNSLIEATKNPQFLRLFLEYIPLTFSRRHGDPSRPWNIFSINIKSPDDKPILNYEGNWRDIFQNWEALAYSYPSYIKNMYAKFLNAMTADGYNPYKINRAGIDWEIPDPTNPWAQIGYWGDHQIIYFEKLLELYSQTNYEKLLADINERIYTSTNVPYRIAAYKKILEDPRNTIIFDKALSNNLQQASKKYGSDKKLILDTGSPDASDSQLAQGQPYLLTFAAKVMQIVLTKAANFVPGGGIWLNTQRPEWNDANNALAGYGLSVVTLCYLCRFINTLSELFEKSPVKKVTLPKTEIKFLRAVKKIYAEFNEQSAGGKKSPATDPVLRKTFVDRLGLAYEKERNELYKNGYGTDNQASDIPTSELITCLKEIQKQVEATIALNKRKDGLYHSYNTLKISGDKMFVENLNEMLEGQVAVLSSGLVSTKEAADIIKSLYVSKMYEPNQNSFMLYPNKELPKFWEKNDVEENSLAEYKLNKIIARTGNLYLQKDCNGIWHFNSDFRNADVIKDLIQNQEPQNRPTAAEEKSLFDLYEKTFNHQSFTGRSGTFYAYEGLGSIYWHMVSKLLLAVQENALKAYKEKNIKLFIELKDLYYKVRSGLGYNKTPQRYGAFPADPYSHTPYLQGAKQPGMTGQVKEEILTRWNELGLFIENGTVTFNPVLLQADEIAGNNRNKSLSFTWCGIPVTYIFSAKDEPKIILKYGKKGSPTVLPGNSLNHELTSEVFNRSGKIKELTVFLKTV